MRKILFLDIDGVLNSFDNSNSRSLLYKLSDDNKSRDEFGRLFDERCVRWLTYIVEMTDCKIVISSTWRKSGLIVMKEMWEKRKLPGEVIDITPLEPNEKLINLYGEYDVDRGYEIQEWLDKNKWNSYCIVDDYYGMLEHQNFVETRGREGLTKDTSLLIIEYLNHLQ